MDFIHVTFNFRNAVETIKHILSPEEEHEQSYFNPIEPCMRKKTRVKEVTCGSLISKEKKITRRMASRSDAVFC